MENKKNKRNTNIEILRFILMLVIFGWHLLVHGYELKNIDGCHIIVDNMQLILLTIFSPATYCFMFISGYYGIKYSNKKFIQIIFMCYFAVIVSSIIKELIGLPVNRWELFFPITRGGLWFVRVYILIMIISPIINFGLEKITKTQLRFIVLIMLYFLCASLLQLKVNNGSNMFGLLTVYLLGRYMNIHKVGFSLKKSIFFYLVSSIALIAILWFVNILKSNKVFVLLSYCNPLIIIMAVSLFFIFYKLKPLYCNQINKFLSPLLMIYLVTEFLGERFYYMITSTDSSIKMIIVVLIVSLLCIFFGHVTNFIFDKLYKGLCKEKTDKI